MTQTHASTDEVRTLRCTTTADFLAALPQLTGFIATQCLFVVFFCGKRAGPTMRVDLPVSDEPRELARFVGAVCEIVHDTRQRSGADGDPAVVISCEETFADSRGVPWRRLAVRLERRLLREGIRLRELCCLAPDGWASYLEPAMPRAGHPLSEISASPVASNVPLPTLESIGQFEEPDPHDHARVLAKLSRIEASARVHSSAVDATVATVLVGAEQLSPSKIASLIAAANRRQGWMALLEQLTATAAAAYGDTPLTEPDMREAGERLRAAALRLVQAVEHAPDSHRPAVISLCAMAWWLRGIQSVAARQIEVALGLDPEHEPSIVIGRVIESGSAPFITGAA